MTYVLPQPTALVRGLLTVVLASFFSVSQGLAAERERIETFLEITGFDVALDSIALSAGGAPDMLGLQPGVFGSDWERLSGQVFDTTEMHELALQILEETLEDAALDHAAAFYASDLGQRLVAAENASHLVEDDLTKQEAGQRIIASLVKDGDGRVGLFQRMGSAIGAADSGLKAIQQIQFRFLMAASAAGVIEMELDADGLRALMKEQEGEILLALKASSLAGAAYTYQGFSEQELLNYVEALEQPLMQQVYELLNAVQYEITANRFELLAYRLSELHPGQDI